MKNTQAVRRAAAIAAATSPRTRAIVHVNVTWSKAMRSDLITKAVFFVYAAALIGVGVVIQDVAKAPLHIVIMLYLLGGCCVVAGWHSKRFSQPNGKRRG
jgi:hypothetical protein